MSLAAQAKAVAHEIGGEQAGLDAELDLGQGGADILGGPRAFPAHDRPDLEPTRFQHGEAEAIIRRLERERIVAARAIPR